jgi:hypothetical protein
VPGAEPDVLGDPHPEQRRPHGGRAV